MIEEIALRFLPELDSAPYCRARIFMHWQGSGGMPTAFAATWGNGSSVLGSYAEYGAVPGQSQQVVPFKAPRERLHAAIFRRTCRVGLRLGSGPCDQALLHPHLTNTVHGETECGAYWSVVIVVEMPSSTSIPAAASVVQGGWRRRCRAISSLRSICAGPNVLPPCTAMDAGLNRGSVMYLGATRLVASVLPRCTPRR
jgi:hypothetical protein